MNKRKVAIIQNRFQRGGRMQVIIHMVKQLNKRCIVPDLLSFQSNITKDDIKNAYGEDIEFTFKDIFMNLRIPFEWNILCFNFISRFYLKNYDLVINSNNTSFLLPKDINMVSYVHFPRKKRNIIPQKSIHFSKGNKKKLLDVKSDLFKIAHYLYRFDRSISKRDLQLANSDYTKETLLSLYPLGKQEVKVMYPPVNVSSDKNNTPKKRQVVSLGRFSPDKRQLEQVKIAQQIPELEFHLYGFVNSNTYYNTIESYIAHHSIDNVHLHPNAPFDDIKNALAESAFFLHSLRREPFGITTVQAIQNGCIPVVHNSGGQAEIVSEKTLRYENVDEAIDIIKRLNRKKDSVLDNYRSSLRNNIENYSAQKFEQEFDKILEEKL
ncbi:glycosyltransferase [Gracilimonas sp.]|uniref:glycosyltransferase n=1 Tax=Gracilimonas sp. TaxID=1974203 RepID=UPI002871E3AA|nr:glycosyltransferase [Gracilimonas sp.]